jgi:RHS repeat-associated protein
MAKTVGSTTVGSEFLYNANRSRTVQLEFTGLAGGVPSGYVRKRVYGLGSTLEANYEAQTPSGNPTWNLKKVRIYVPGPDGIIGSREFDPAAPIGSQEKAFIYHYDHLGSIESITPFVPAGSGLAADSTGKPGRFSEDAWGQRRNPLTWSGVPTATDDGGADSLTPRGFTGHEMLDDLGLVNMNGRIYNPLFGRMQSADATVPGRTDLQAYNRYSYVLNNPLRYTDPDGNEPKDVAAGAIEGPAYAVIDVGSYSPGLQNFNESTLMMMGLSNLLGNDKNAAYYSSLRAEGRQMQQSLSDNAERMKTVVSDWASEKTGSTDVNNSQRAITRETTNILTKLIVALGGSKFIDRLSANQVKTGSGDQGRVSSTPVNKQVDNRGKYSHLKEPKTVGPGLKTTRAQRARILSENKKQNAGMIRSDQSGAELSHPRQLKAREPRPANEAQVDHIDERSEGGSNSNANQQVLSFQENLEKELKRRKEERK